MTSKKSEKSQTIRLKILETALHLFAEKGYKKATLREIAEKTGMALGAFYYYFGSKEEIVFAFYERTHQETVAHIHTLIQTHDSFEKLLYEVILFRLKQFEPYRPLLQVLAKFALDPEHEFSPFSERSEHLRKQDIDWFAQIIVKSKLKGGKALDTLPTLLWGYQLAITLFWIYDHSENQFQTQRVLKIGNNLIVSALKLSFLPPVKALLKQTDGIIKMVLGTVVKEKNIYLENKSKDYRQSSQSSK